MQDIEVGSSDDLATFKVVVKKGFEILKKSLEDQISSSDSATADLIDSRSNRLSVAIDDQSLEVSKLKTKSERLEELGTARDLAIESLLGADRQMSATLDKLTRQQEETQHRLDGTRIPQIKELSLEAIRALQTQQQELLGGNGGRIPYLEILAKVENNEAVGRFAKAVVALFGSGAVIGAIGLLFGVGKSPDLMPQLTAAQVSIQTQEQRIKTLEAQIVRMENRVFAGK